MRASEEVGSMFLSIKLVVNKNKYHHLGYRSSSICEGINGWFSLRVTPIGTLPA